MVFRFDFFWFVFLFFFFFKCVDAVLYLDYRHVFSDLSANSKGSGEIALMRRFA